MVLNKILAIMGSPGSGKTTTAVKLAESLAKMKKNVIVVFCDPFTPVIPALVSPDIVHDISLGYLLTAPGFVQKNILKACVPLRDNEYISLLGYKSGESLMNYPKIIREKAVELFVSLRYMANCIILDCSTVFEADPTSIVAIETADRVLFMGTANLKGISYYQTHIPMLSDSRFDKNRQRMAIGCQKVGQDWEAVSGQYGGVDFVLPYTQELEQQDNERTLFQPLVAMESASYCKEINKIVTDTFGLQAKVTKNKNINKDKRTGQSDAIRKDRSGRGGFRLPFMNNRGEF